MIKALFIGMGAVVIIGLALWGIFGTNDLANGAVITEKCQPCDCKITAERVKGNAKIIELPENAVEFKYQGETFTLKELQMAKSLNK